MWKRVTAGRIYFFDRSSSRWKFDALLSFSVARDWANPFAQIVIDSDFGPGSDSIQSFFGIDFDVTKLFGTLSFGDS